MSGGLTNIDNVVPTEAQPETKAEAEAPQVPNTTAAGNSDRVLLSWSGQSFDYKEKGFIWFLIFGLFVLLVAAYLVWQQDWFTLGILAVVTAVLVWYVTTARPENQDYSISTFGISISGHYYPFADIHSFWMVYTPKVQKLYFAQAKKYLPTVIMDISGVNPDQVRTILSRKIPEQPARGENILDQIIRMLGI